MMRPSDQAKLLFLYLLRSSSALASPRVSTTTSVSTLTSTTTTTTVGLNSHGHVPSTTAVSATTRSTPSSRAALSSPLHDLRGYISLRVATRSDVPSIQKCNVATLPENYSSNFYVNHLRSFPDLALVAEHVPPPSSSSSSLSDTELGYRRNPFENYNPNQRGGQKPNIIGYVLGKIEDPQNASPDYFPPPPERSRISLLSSTSTGDDDLDEYLSRTNQQQQQTERNIKIGHVTSLAVTKPYRRNGIAALLMRQLHYHMKYGHSASYVGLHVRVSNIAARRLYCEGMGYGVADVIRGYYQDGEDAFFMKKDLSIVEDEEYKVIQHIQQLEHEIAMEGEEQERKERQRQIQGGIGSRLQHILESSRRKNYNSRRSSMSIHEHGPIGLRLPLIIPLGENEQLGVPSFRDDASEEEEECAQVMTGSL
mmetsp:Transcript_28395/g.35117  ORF Transcript_28395/g.35117 Transcript_28395/m.35117 type:complete len:424 (-) Transcript_28395:244-1515(-)